MAKITKGYDMYSLQKHMFAVERKNIKRVLTKHLSLSTIAEVNDK